eukprot:497899-Prorocentrum_minimum.AAC.1
MPAAPQFPPFVAFQKPNGLTVTFACSKPVPGNPAVTMVTATYTNAGAVPIADLVLQVRRAIASGWCVSDDTRPRYH